jgi:transposase
MDVKVVYSAPYSFIGLPIERYFAILKNHDYSTPPIKPKRLWFEDIMGLITQRVRALNKQMVR